MPVVDINNVSINYSQFGDATNPTILLIHGLGQPAAAWPGYFIDALLARGFSILTLDNRDMGKSQKLDELGIPNILNMIIRQRLGMKNTAPYALEDMMHDTRGLLEHLQLGPVHVVGASMGGMIAQLLAIHAPQHVASLTSVMSHTGNPKLKGPKLSVMKQLISKPKSWEFEDRLVFSMKTWRMIGSPAYPSTDDELRYYVTAILENGAHPPGTGRQMAAILAANDRRADLQKLQIPSLVIHGDADPLVRPQGGVETAESIPGAKLEMIAGMGHDLPEALSDTIADMIQQHIEHSITADG
jgi:pimeloyl-ACP methyl ester carboxylesterase